MNYEYPLNRNRLRIEQEELLLKLALFHYLERENDRLRARMQEQPGPAGGPGKRGARRGPCHATAALAGLRAKGLAGLRAGVTRVADVFLTFFICLSTAFAVSPSVRSAVYKMNNFPAGPLYQCNGGPTPAGHVHRCGPLHLGARFAPTYLPEGYELAIFEDLAGIELLVSYEKGDKYIDFTQTSSGTHCSVSVQVDSENAQITRPIMIGYSEGIYNLKDGETSIVWQVGESMLSLLSNEDTEEVIKIAESIQLLR